MSTVDYISAPTIALLGRGAFSEVSLKKVSLSSSSSSSIPHHLVAVKHFVRQDAILAGRVDRILAEKKALELLKTDDLPTYCVKLIDTYKNEMTLGFVYEPIFGGTLSQHISLQTRLSISTVQIYSAELIAALHHLGCLGIMHRDIKSKNILLDSRGHLKLGDFGSSKLLEPIFPRSTVIGSQGLSSSSSSKSFSKYDDEDDVPPVSPAQIALNKAGVKSFDEMQKAFTFIGTEYSMAPEVLSRKDKKPKGSEGYSYPVDYWSLGILILEMLIGNSFINYAPLEARSARAMKIDELSSIAGADIGGQHAATLVRALLEDDPRRRLIAADFTAISIHPFFDSIDWIRIIEGDQI